MRVKLERVAHLRSGDKGDIANIAVIAYAPELYQTLKQQLTAERMKAFYKGILAGDVERYSIDSLGMLNFVAHGALRGGVSRSLCLDNYGKSLSAALLGFALDVPDEYRMLLRGPASEGRNRDAKADERSSDI